MATNRKRNTGSTVRSWEAERRAREKQRLEQSREDARRKREAEKLAKLQHEEAMLADAARKTAGVQQKSDQLDALLRFSLENPLTFNLAELRTPYPTVALDLGSDAVPAVPPTWDEFCPAPPGAISRLFGGKQLYEEDLVRARERFQVVQRAYEDAERSRAARVIRKRDEHRQRVDQERHATDQRNGKIDWLQHGLNAGGRHEVSEYFELALSSSRYPVDFPRGRRAGYVPESKLLAVELQLPDMAVVPVEREFKYVKTRDVVQAVQRPVTAVRQQYQSLVAQLALRTLREVFGLDKRNLVDTVVFNGKLDTINPVNGQPVQPILITLRATRERFEELNLDHVDAVSCIKKHFHADVSKNPAELEPVTPIMEFDMADPRIIDPVDVISGLDKRPNLLEMPHKTFEHFVHNLFDLMGFDTKVFKADGDGGVDCVAYDPTPIKGGKYVIQAKLYTRTVAPTYVRDLYGTMQHEGAKSGILITTSGYGPTSYEFASGKPLQLIDGSGLLALCAEYGIPARIVPIKKK